MYANRIDWTGYDLAAKRAFTVVDAPASGEISPFGVLLEEAIENRWRPKSDADLAREVGWKHASVISHMKKKPPKKVTTKLSKMFELLRIEAKPIMEGISVAYLDRPAGSGRVTMTLTKEEAEEVAALLAIRGSELGKGLVSAILAASKGAEKGTHRGKP